MAFLVLLSSTSFLVSTHLCAGEVAEVSYFTSAHTCGEDATDSCHSEESSHVEKPLCCSTESQIIPSHVFLDMDKGFLQKMVAPFIVLPLHVFSFVEINEVLRVDKQKKIPLFITSELHILYETFLI